MKITRSAVRVGHKPKTKGSYERMGPLSVLLVALLGTFHLGLPARPRGDARARRFRGPGTAAPGRTFERAPPIRKYNRPIVLLRNALKSTIRQKLPQILLLRPPPRKCRAVLLSDPPPPRRAGGRGSRRGGRQGVGGTRARTSAPAPAPRRPSAARVSMQSKRPMRA